MLKREEPDYNHDNLQELLALPKVFIFFLIFGSPEENNVRVFFLQISLASCKREPVLPERAGDCRADDLHGSEDSVLHL